MDERVEVVAKALYEIVDAGVKAWADLSPSGREGYAKEAAGVLAALDAYEREHEEPWPTLDSSALQCGCGATLAEPCQRTRRDLFGRERPNPCRYTPESTEQPDELSDAEREAIIEAAAREALRISRLSPAGAEAERKGSEDHAHWVARLIVDAALTASPGQPEHADVHRCEDCNRPTSEAIGSYWLADDELWAEIVGDDTIVLCPSCFHHRARGQHISVSWRAVREISTAPPIQPEENRLDRDALDRLCKWAVILRKTTGLEDRDNDEQVKVEGALLHSLSQAIAAVLDSYGPVLTVPVQPEEKAVEDRGPSESSNRAAMGYVYRVLWIERAPIGEWER